MADVMPHHDASNPRRNPLHDVAGKTFLEGLNFTNIFMRSFYTHSSQKRKSLVKSTVSFYAFWDLRAQKLLMKSTPDFP